MKKILRSPARRARRGFTMIELIGVVALIAILVGVAQANFGGTKQDAYEQAMSSDAKNFVSAQEQHYHRQDRYMAAVQAAGTPTATTGNFRLSEDVGIQITGVTQNGYTANFMHRKWGARLCSVVVSNTTGTRTTCTTPGAVPVATSFTFQN